MERLIDARYLTSQMYMICEACNTENIFIDAIIDEIDNAPTVDAVEVVHGRWEDVALRFTQTKEKCSVCGGIVYAHGYNYCPNCGAKMDGERKEND